MTSEAVGVDDVAARICFEMGPQEKSQCWLERESDIPAGWFHIYGKRHAKLL